MTNKQISTLCVECFGAGEIACPFCATFSGPRKCLGCGGTGQYICPNCEGVKRVPFELVKGERVCVLYSPGFEPMRGIVHEVCAGDDFVLLREDGELERIPYRYMAVCKDTMMEAFSERRKAACNY